MTKATAAMARWLSKNGTVTVDDAQWTLGRWGTSKVRIFHQEGWAGVIPQGGSSLKGIACYSVKMLAKTLKTQPI